MFKKSKLKEIRKELKKNFKSYDFNYSMFGALADIELNEDWGPVALYIHKMNVTLMSFGIDVSLIGDATKNYSGFAYAMELRKIEKEFKDEFTFAKNIVDDYIKLSTSALNNSLFNVESNDFEELMKTTNELKNLMGELTSEE